MPTIIYDIVGTTGDDVLTSTDQSELIGGYEGNDIIIGSAGNDAINGGLGFDTVDYSKFNFSIVLKPAGLVDIFYGNVTPKVIKGNLGQDNLGILGGTPEKVIAPAGQLNTIDASGTIPNGVLVVNLEKKQLSLTGIQNPVWGGELPAVNLQIENFVNVIGTAQGDTITGDAANNTLNGGGGDDQLFGKKGDDNLIGSTGNDLLVGGFGNDTLLGTDTTARGASELDTLVLGKGQDTVILGDATGAYYKDAGKNDLAIIQGVSAKDTVILSSKETYSVDLLQGNGLNLYVMQGSNKELIANFEHVPGTVLKDINTEPFQISAGQTLGIFLGI